MRMMMLLQLHAVLMMLQLLCCVDDEKNLMIYRYASQCSKMILMMLSSHPFDAVDDVILSLSHLMLLKNTLLVKREC